MTRLLILALGLLALSVDPDGGDPHTVWEDEDEAREAALAAAEAAEGEVDDD